MSTTASSDVPRGSDAKAHVVALTFQEQSKRGRRTAGRRIHPLPAFGDCA